MRQFTSRCTVAQEQVGLCACLTIVLLWRHATLAPCMSAADVLERVRSVSQMRVGKSSIMLMGGQHSSPDLGCKNGSLASYFYAPHPQPGRGVCFSPKGVSSGQMACFWWVKQGAPALA